MHRSILLSKGGSYWVYVYLFAKKDRDNIKDHELADFRELAKNYAIMDNDQIDQLLLDKDLMEICRGEEE